MRQAYQVWSGIAAVVFVVVAVADLSGKAPTTATASSQQGPSGSSALPSPTPLASAGRAADSTVAPIDLPAPSTEAGEQTLVTKVIDGDTIEVRGGRKIQIIGIDACEPGTYGGDQAAESARTILENESVTLTRAPGVDIDKRGSDLRFVAYSGGSDFGEFAVVFEHTTVYEKHGAPEEYMARLRSRDDGPQRCTAPGSSSGSNGGGSNDGGSIDWPTPGDQGMPDGALTGGYCRKKWWC